MRCWKERKVHSRAPFEIRFRQLDYDREQAVRDALAAPQIPLISAYIHELKTGIYSRHPVSGSAASAPNPSK